MATVIGITRPATSEEAQDDTGKKDADEDSIANTFDTRAHQFGLIVEGRELDSARHGFAKLFDLRCYSIGNRDGVA